MAAIRLAPSLVSKLAADRRPRLPASQFSVTIADRMARLGIVLYWAATAIAIALVVLAVFAYFTATGRALASALLIVGFAGLVWLTGRGILYFFAGR